MVRFARRPYSIAEAISNDGHRVGGFTTFSAFSLDAVLLWEHGQIAAAVAYVGLSVVGAVLGVFFGLAILRSLLS
jgi:CrcB protein